MPYMPNPTIESTVISSHENTNDDPAPAAPVDSIAPPPKASRRKSPTASNQPPAAKPHCRHRVRTGAYCRLPGLESQSGFCSRHFRPLAFSFPSSPDDSEDLSSDLLPEPTDFSSGEDIQKFLARLVVQVTRGRVSTRRAAVLGYLTNQLLHSHRAIDKEEENEPKQFIFDLPRPKRD